MLGESATPNDVTHRVVYRRIGSQWILITWRILVNANVTWVTALESLKRCQRTPGETSNLIDRANDLRYSFLIIRYGQQIMAIAIGRASYQPRDVLFVLLLVACLLLSASAIFSGLETRQAALVQGGARKVDAAKIRKQILDGHLSPRKALFNRRLPR